MLSDDAKEGLNHGATVAGVSLADFKDQELEKIGLHFLRLKKENKGAIRAKKLAKATPELLAALDAMPDPE